MNIEIKPPVAILGYGVEGRAAFSLLQNRGIKNITIFDESMKESSSDGDKIFKNKLENLSNFNTIIRSPGVYYKRKEIIEAKESGVNVTSMTEMVLEVAKERITAITGSNGKTTTTALTNAILQKYYEGNIIVGGNDGEPTLTKALKEAYPILMEVSSFQFSDIHISPHIAAVLNITPNHMDWHEDLEDYINAKNNLIAHQEKDDWAVLNINNENSAKMAVGAPGKVFWVGKRKGKNWAMWKNGIFGINGEAIINKDEVKIKTHPDNIAFAAAIAKIHEVPTKTIKEALMEFAGVEHRLEYVIELNGIAFYNDSSCTTPESAEVAIEQFEDGKLILLLGGSSKNADFAFLANKIKEHSARAYLYGEEGERIMKALEKTGAQNLILHYNKSGDFEGIIKDVFSQAKKGDSIVLSPACASFDMFKNAKERGYQFKDIVKGL